MTISEASIKHAEEEHQCPHCNTTLSCCATPPMHVGDGLGWGSDVFFICLNDECTLFIDGWEYIEEQYGKVASYRYMMLPGEKKGTPMMVGSKAAFTGNIVDLEKSYKNSERYIKEKECISNLNTCIKEKDLEPILYLITDEDAHLEGRRNACKLLGQLCDISCIDPIRNHKFRHKEIGQLADIAISNILKKTFQKECPSCAEIIKAQAKICRFCGK